MKEKLIDKLNMIFFFKLFIDIICFLIVKRVLIGDVWIVLILIVSVGGGYVKVWFF